MLPSELARVVEQGLVKGLALGSERGLKALIQVVVANLAFSRFMPYWKDITPSCQGPYSEGGFPGSEDGARLLSTLFFYCSVPVLLHLLLNTFVYGLAPASSETSKEATLSGGRHMATRVESYLDVAQDAQMSRFYDARLYEKARLCSPLRWLFPTRGGHKQEECDRILEHEPGFWHLPNVFWVNYFAQQPKSVAMYFKMVLWKLKILCFMTLGWWNDEVLETQQIKFRSDVLDLNIHDPFEKHEEMVSSK